jgi:hypothetical protein
VQHTSLLNWAVVFGPGLIRGARGQQLLTTLGFVKTQEWMDKWCTTMSISLPILNSERALSVDNYHPRRLQLSTT